VKKYDASDFDSIVMLLEEFEFWFLVEATILETKFSTVTSQACHSLWLLVSGRSGNDCGLHPILFMTLLARRKLRNKEATNRS
jgi:hypothetical protein